MTKFDPEALGEKIDPVILMQVIESLESEKAIQSYLRTRFIDLEDVDWFIMEMEADRELELTQRQVLRLKAILVSFKIYLEEYLVQSAARIARLDKRLHDNDLLMVQRIAFPEEQKILFRTRLRLSRAMAFVQKPQINGKSLRQVANRIDHLRKERQQEQETENTLASLKNRFKLNRSRHKECDWDEVELSLRNNPEILKLLKFLERHEGEPDVFWEDQEAFWYTEFYRTIPDERKSRVLDKLAEDHFKSRFPHMGYRGIVSTIVEKMGFVDLQNDNQYRHFQTLGEYDLNGDYTMLKTPEEVRNRGKVLIGTRHENQFVRVVEIDDYVISDKAGFRCVVRLPKRK